MTSPGDNEANTQAKRVRTGQRVKPDEVRDACNTNENGRS
jgi:hypothetical protein